MIVKIARHTYTLHINLLTKTLLLYCDYIIAEFWKFLGCIIATNFSKFNYSYVLPIIVEHDVARLSLHCQTSHPFIGLCYEPTIKWMPYKLYFKSMALPYEKLIAKNLLMPHLNNKLAIVCVAQSRMCAHVVAIYRLSTTEKSYSLMAQLSRMCGISISMVLIVLSPPCTLFAM